MMSDNRYAQLKAELRRGEIPAFAPGEDQQLTMRLARELFGAGHIQTDIATLLLRELDGG